MNLLTYIPVLAAESGGGEGGGSFLVSRVEAGPGDTVLDVALMAKWVHKLSSHVTLVRVPGALHDVTLHQLPSASPAPRTTP